MTLIIYCANKTEKKSKMKQCSFPGATQIERPAAIQSIKFMPAAAN